MRAALSAWILVAIAAVAVLTSACVGNTTTPTQAIPFSATDLVVGTGTAATDGKTVTVTYTGWFYDATKPDKKGIQIDSSAGRDPLVFILGGATTITGFEQGIVGMLVGGSRRLVLPPSMAYGQSRVGQIPPNSTLVFDVNLLDVQ